MKPSSSGASLRVEVIDVMEDFSVPVEVVRRGDIDDADVEYAMKRVDVVMDMIGAPVLFIRVRLSRTGEGGPVRPSLAQATLDINGQLIRAHVAAGTMTEAIDLLVDRLRDQIQHRAERRRARRATGRLARPGEWRHGDLPRSRSLFAERPAEEREVVRRKSFAIDPATPDEAAADMEQLDYDFWLFRDVASDSDALIERLPDGGYRLQRARPVAEEVGPIAIDLDVVDQPPPTTTLDEAIGRLEDGGQYLVFFIDAETGCGNVVYRRYDGNYGQLSST
ncbi:MAG: HPF/RaiA family ribosome-associated protein [Ilumatobacteraceae bacterium]